MDEGGRCAGSDRPHIPYLRYSALEIGAAHRLSMSPSPNARNPYRKVAEPPAAWSMGGANGSRHPEPGERCASDHRWVEARKFVDDAAKRMAAHKGSRSLSIEAIAGELGAVKDRLVSAGLPVCRSSREDAQFARQISVWCVRKDRRSATLLIRQALTLLVIRGDAPTCG